LEKICAAQKREIDILKEKAISDLSQVEHLKGIIDRDRNPAYLQLLRAKQMNPATLKELKDIEKRYS